MNLRSVNLHHYQLQFILANTEIIIKISTAAIKKANHKYWEIYMKKIEPKGDE